MGTFEELDELLGKAPVLQHVSGEKDRLDDVMQGLMQASQSGFFGKATKQLYSIPIGFAATINDILGYNEGRDFWLNKYKTINQIPDKGISLAEFKALPDVEKDRFFSAIEDVRRTASAKPPRDEQWGEELIKWKKGLLRPEIGDSDITAILKKGLKKPVDVIDEFISGFAGTTIGALAGTVSRFTEGKYGKELANKVENFQSLMSSDDPDFFTKLSNALGSVYGFYVPGLAIARTASAFKAISPTTANWLGAGGAAIMEAGAEGGFVFNDVLDKTGDVEKAKKAADETFMTNVGVIAITNKLGLFGDTKSVTKKLLSSFVSEGFQEATQDIIPAVAKREPLDVESIKESAFYGGLAGGLVGGISQRIENKSQLIVENRARFSEAESIAFRKSLAEIVAKIKPENDTQKLVIGLASDALEQGNVAEASKLINQIVSKLPDEQKQELAEDATYTEHLVEEMQKVEAEIVEEQEGLKMKEEEEVYQKPLWLVEEMQRQKEIREAGVAEPAEPEALPEGKPAPPALLPADQTDLWFREGLTEEGWTLKKALDKRILANLEANKPMYAGFTKEEHAFDSTASRLLAKQGKVQDRIIANISGNRPLFFKVEIEDVRYVFDEARTKARIQALAVFEGKPFAEQVSIALQGGNITKAVADELLKPAPLPEEKVGISEITAAMPFQEVKGQPGEAKPSIEQVEIDSATDGIDMAAEALFRGEKTNERGERVSISKNDALAEIQNALERKADFVDWSADSQESARQTRILEKVNKILKTSYKNYNEIPDNIQIYRGMEKTRKLRNFENYTLDKKIAQKFAGQDGIVKEFSIHKDNIQWANKDYIGFSEGEIFAYKKDVNRLPEEEAKPTVPQIPADIIKQAQELLIPIKDKTPEGLIKEIIAKRAEVEKAEPGIPDKGALLSKLRPLIDKIFTDKKGHIESERESHFARLSRYSPEMLSTTIRNMQEHYRDEVKEIREEEKQALLQAKMEEKAEEAEEGEEFQSPDRDLSKLGEDKLKGALPKSASQQIESNPGMSKEGWTGYIERNFPNIAKSHIEKMWDDAHGKYEQETGIYEKATLEHHLQNTLDQFGKELHESTEGDLNIALKKIAEVDVPIDPDVAVKSKDYDDYVERMKHEKPGDYAKKIRDTVKTGKDLLPHLKDSPDEATSEYGRALFNSSDISAWLESVNVKVNLFAALKKRSLYYTDKSGVKWIELNLPQILQKHTIVKEIHHEINHALFVEKMKDPKVRKAFIPIFDQYLATFSPEEVKTIEWMREHDGSVHPTMKDQSGLNDLFYSAQSLDELAAMVSESEALRNYLSGVKYVPSVGEKPGVVMSLLTKFWNIVKAKVYGNAPGIDASLLEVLLSRTAEVMEMPAPSEVKPGKVEAKAPPRVEDMLDVVSEMTGEARFSGKNLLKDTQPPVWDKHLSTVTEAMYAISRSAHRASFHAANMINKFIRKEGISDAVTKVVVDSDAAGVLTGYENLSPSDKVKHDAIRSTFDFVIRDYMKRLYVDDAMYRLGKQEGRVVTSEEKSRIVKEADDFINKHYTENYYPRFRFGNQALVIRDEKGKTISFSSHDSARELNRVLTNFEQTMKGLQKYDETGNQTTPTFQHFDVRQKFTDFSAIMFAVSNARVLENILAKHDATSQDIKKLMSLVGTEYLKKWAGGRFAHRQETVTPGYDTDIAKSIHRYIESMPKAMAKHFMAARVADAVAELPFELQERGQDIVDFYNGKKWREGRVNIAIRTALFAYYMMLKPVTGLINATQRFITTVPRAFKDYGMEGIQAAHRAQMKEINFYKLQLKQSNFNIFKPKPSFEVLDDFNEISYGDKLILKNLIAEGVISPVRTHEIVEESKIGKIVGFFMALTENSNRLMSAFTALDIGHMKGLKGQELETYVREFTNGTQWIYDKANRAPLTRGKLAPVMLFKSFVLNDMNFVKDLYPNKKAFGMAVAARLSLGGVGGIYGAGAFMAVLDFVMKSILGDDDWELDKKEFKDKFPRVIIHGLPSLIGISGSSMFGSSELFGTAMTPPFTAWWRVGKEFGTTTGVQPETWRKVLPSQAKHFWRLNLKDRFQDEDIKQLPVEIRKRVLFLWKDTPKEQQTWEKVIDIIGFATETPAQFYEAVHAIKETGRIVRARKTRLARKLADALYEKDKEKAAEIRKEMKEKGYIISPTSVTRFRRRRRYAEEE